MFQKISALYQSCKVNVVVYLIEKFVTTSKNGVKKNVDVNF